MSAAPIFDRLALRRHRDRAAATIDRHDFLLREAADRLTDRLDVVRRTFPIAVDLGARTGLLASLLMGRGGIETLVEIESSPAMAKRSRAGGPRVVGEIEFLPFGEASVDLAISCLALHWVDDLPGALAQIRRMLRPDGLFLASMFGGDTLVELRRAMIEAEIAVASGASPRLSPLVQIRDAGALLQRAGFAMPVVDRDTITVTYASALELMRDLRAIGETNAREDRPRGFTSRAVMLGTARRYAELFAGADGRIPATFEILTLTAWAPHESQRKPLRPGSATARLADALRDNRATSSPTGRPPAAS